MELLKLIPHWFLELEIQVIDGGLNFHTKVIRASQYDTIAIQRIKELTITMIGLGD